MYPDLRADRYLCPEAVRYSCLPSHATASGDNGLLPAIVIIGGVLALVITFIALKRRPGHEPMYPDLRRSLPWPTRARLRLAGWIDGAAYFLVKHGHWKIAITLWRACGMWHAKRHPVHDQI